MDDDDSDDVFFAVDLDEVNRIVAQSPSAHLLSSMTSPASQTADNRDNSTMRVAVKREAVAVPEMGQASALRQRTAPAPALAPVQSQIHPSYISRQLTCWKCKKSTQVYSWLGHRWMQDHPPPQPQPLTIKYKFSSQANGSYWANTCSYCGALQGENYCYEGPFHGPLPFSMRGD